VLIAHASTLDGEWVNTVRDLPIRKVTIRGEHARIFFRNGRVQRLEGERLGDTLVLYRPISGSRGGC
jgi:hypothetical protein